ncbi:MAG: DUF4434 domain-containing protein, partial [Rhodospirillales bacterium]|nr:DUF4434 domain-containing protein [Rhodospirillales bacterium]
MTIKRSVLAIVAVLIAVAFFPPLASSAPSPRPHLNGTFLQLAPHHLRWTENDWSRLFDSFQRIGLSEVIVQWSRTPDISYLSSPPTGAADTSPPVIEQLMTIAAQRGLGVT